MLPFLADRIHEYNADSFVNELFEASKLLGALEAKIDGYQFNSILIPIFMAKEAVSSMQIEGTQTTITDVFEDRIGAGKNQEAKVARESRNHTNALAFGVEYLRANAFSDELFKSLHQIMMNDILPPKKQQCIGKYKEKDNYIVNSFGSVVFVPPSYTETPKYMRELIQFMNDTSDEMNPLIKAAIIHSQFESIHPFEDGNGRVGRILVSLYLYKAQVINFPYFYISEAINQDKAVYYNKLTDSRSSSYNEWIKFFLRKCIVQASKLIHYIDSLNTLYLKTKAKVKSTINTPKFDQIINCIFTQPIITVAYLASQLSVTAAQARRYIDKMVEQQILFSNDRKRGRKFVFLELLDLARAT